MMIEKGNLMLQTFFDYYKSTFEGVKSHTFCSTFNYYIKNRGCIYFYDKPYGQAIIDGVTLLASTLIRNIRIVTLTIEGISDEMQNIICNNFTDGTTFKNIHELLTKNGYYASDFYEKGDEHPPGYRDLYVYYEK